MSRGPLARQTRAIAHRGAERNGFARRRRGARPGRRAARGDPHQAGRPACGRGRRSLGHRGGRLDDARSRDDGAGRADSRGRRPDDPRRLPAPAARAGRAGGRDALDPRPDRLVLEYSTPSGAEPATPRSAPACTPRRAVAGRLVGGARRGGFLRRRPPRPAANRPARGARPAVPTGERQVAHTHHRPLLDAQAGAAALERLVCSAMRSSPSRHPARNRDRRPAKSEHDVGAALTDPVSRGSRALSRARWRRPAASGALSWSSRVTRRRAW